MSRALVPPCCLALVFAAAAIGTAPAAPVPKHLMRKTEPVYFATTVGTKWVYLYNGRETTDEITAVEDRDGVKRVSVKGGANGDAVWQVSSSGLSILSMGTQVCDPPLPMLRLPLEDNKAWDVHRGDGTGLAGVFAAHGPEEVAVGAGKFQAIRVEVEWIPNNKVTFWYAPGVGVVKTGGGMEKELKSFTPGKATP